MGSSPTTASILFIANSCLVLSLLSHPSTSISLLNPSQGVIRVAGAGGKGWIEPFPKGDPRTGLKETQRGQRVKLASFLHHTDGLEFDSASDQLLILNPSSLCASVVPSVKLGPCRETKVGKSPAEDRT